MHGIYMINYNFKRPVAIFQAFEEMPSQFAHPPPAHRASL